MSLDVEEVSSIQIRVPSTDELNFLSDIERQAMTVFSETDLPLVLRAGTIPMATLAAATATGLLRVAATADRPVGFALLEVHEDAMYLAEISVLPEFARRGIGRQLVSAILDIARDRGVSRVTLTTFDHLPWNRPFYERCGFRTVAERNLPTRLRKKLMSERAIGLSGRVGMMHGE